MFIAWNTTKYDQNILEIIKLLQLNLLSMYVTVVLLTLHHAHSWSIDVKIQTLHFLCKSATKVLQ